MRIDGLYIYEPIAFSKHGPVWRAVDTKGSECAVQLLSLPDENWQSRIGELLSVRCEHLVTLRSVEFLDSGRMAVVSDLARGQNLELISLGQRFCLPQLNLIALCVAKALEQLHESGLCHGDIAPANIMVLRNGNIQVLDFLNLPADLGTPGFAAPQRSAGASAEGDVYSWAAMLEYLGLKHPFLKSCLCENPLDRPTISEAVALFSQMPTKVIDLLDNDQLGCAKMRAAGRDIRTVQAKELLDISSSSQGNNSFTKDFYNSTNKAPMTRRRREKTGRKRRKSLLKSLVIVPAFITLTILGGLGGWWFFGTQYGIALVPIQKTQAAENKQEPKDENKGKSENKEHRDVELVGKNKQSSLGNEENIVDQEYKPINFRLDTKNDGPRFINQWLKARDRGLMDQNEQAISALSVPGSLLERSDLQLIRKLKNSGIRIEGLETKAKNIEVLNLSKTQARILATLQQESYLQIDHSGQTRHVNALPEKQVEMILKSDPWRVAAVVNVSN